LPSVALSLQSALILFTHGPIMNRKKKIFDKFNKKVKKAKARMNPGTKGSKPKYISKAERAKLDAAAAQEQLDSGSEQSVEASAQDQAS